MIGALDALTGSGASAGLDTIRGAQLAVDVIDHGGSGISLPLAGKGLPGLGGAKVKLVTGDTRGNPRLAAQEVDHLVTVDHVVAITGCYASADTEAASARAEQLQIPFVNGASSAPSLTQRGLQWFFRTGPTDATFADGLFGFLEQQKAAGRQTKRVAILHTTDVYGTGVDLVSRAEAAQHDDLVVADIGYVAATADLTPELRQVEAARPDVLLAASYTSDALLLVRTLRSLDYYPDALLGYGAGFSDPTLVPTLGSAAEGIFTRAAWSPDAIAPNSASTAVARLFQQRFRQPMTENSARSFTATMALAQAISNGRSRHQDDIRRSLLSLDIPGDQTIMPWRGVRFDATNQNVETEGLIEQIRKGRYRVVYPEAAATIAPAWPLRSAPPGGFTA